MIRSLQRNSFGNSSSLKKPTEIKKKHKNIAHEIVSVRGARFESVDNQLLKLLEDGSVRLDATRELILADNEFAVLYGLDTFRYLTVLDVSFNRLETLEGLPPTLVRLDASHNRLTHLNGLEDLTSLIELDVSFNYLESLFGLQHNAQLRNLNASHNNIDRVEFIENLILLESLSLENNNIEFMEHIRSISYHPHLKNLYLKANPISQIAFYKYGCRNMVPGLVTLDGEKLPAPFRTGVGRDVIAHRSTLSPKRSNKSWTSSTQTDMGDFEDLESKLHSEESSPTQQRNSNGIDSNNNSLEEDKKVQKENEEALAKVIKANHKLGGDMETASTTSRSASTAEILDKLAEILGINNENPKDINPMKKSAEEIIRELEVHFDVDLKQHYTIIEKMIILAEKMKTEDDSKRKEYSDRFNKFRKILVMLIDQKRKLLENYQKARAALAEDEDDFSVGPKIPNSPTWISSPKRKPMNAKPASHGWVSFPQRY